MILNKIIYASLARTADPTLEDLGNTNWRGAHIIINVTAIAATPSVVFTVEGKDDIAGDYYPLLVSAAIVGTGKTVLTIYPGAVETANVSTNKSIPKTFRVRAVHADADSITYSVAGNMLN